MARNNKLSPAEAAQQLGVLQNLFSDAAKTSPTIMHIIAQCSKDGIDPIVPDMLTKSCRLWDEKLGRWPRCDDERGYPTKHWLLFVGSLSQSELSEKQCMTTNYDMLGRFCKLASEAGKIVGSMDNIILPISKTELWVKDPEEYWLLLLHRLCLPQHDLWFVPEDENTPNLTLSMRQARENEPYIAVLDNVFLSSAMACGRLAASGEADLADEKLAERGQNIINIEKFNGVLGDVQAENVQTGDHSSIHKPPVTEKKEKGIFRKLLKIIGIVIVAIIAAIVVDILGDLGWLESIKNLILQLK